MCDCLSCQSYDSFKPTSAHDRLIAAGLSYRDAVDVGDLDAEIAVGLLDEIKTLGVPKPSLDRNDGLCMEWLNAKIAVEDETIRYYLKIKPVLPAELRGVCKLCDEPCWDDINWTEVEVEPENRSAFLKLVVDDE